MKKYLMIGAAAAMTFLAAVPAAAATTPPAPAATTVAAGAPASVTSGELPIVAYLLSNQYHRVWMDDGVKGIVKNFTDQRIWVRDTIADKKVTLDPRQAAVFYSDQDLSRFGDLDEGDGTWLEISRAVPNAPVSEFRLCDPTFGRPDTYFSGPGNTVNQRESWNEGESHHELTPTHKFWVKRESDSWKQKYDTWNSSDWPAFSLHVDAI